MKYLVSRPIILALLLFTLTLAAAGYSFVFLRVEGDVARALKGTSEAFVANQQLETQFGAPSKDEVFLVRAANLAEPDTFQGFEDLVIDLQLTEGVRGVLSVFALPDPAGAGVTFLTRADVQGKPAPQRLDALDAGSPVARYLISQDRSAAMIVVMPDLTQQTSIVLANIEETFALADPAFVVKSISLAALQREISTALIIDQSVIAPVATVICVLIALFLFRSWRVAVLCALPSIVGLIATFAAMAALGYPMDPFMAIIPALLIVLGIADSVHVLHAILRQAERADLPTAILLGLRETMPAVVLATLTTALAFLCLLIVGSPTVSSVAVVGPIGLALTGLAVFVVLPPASLLLLRGADLSRVQPQKYRTATGIAVRFLTRRNTVAISALVILAGLFVAQTQTVTGYRLMDHIPRGGEFRETLAEVRSVLPGSDQSFVMLKAADPAPGVSEADRALLGRAGAALYGSENNFVPTRDMQGIESALLTRFQGDDGSHFALPLIGRLDVNWTETQAFADQARRALRDAGIEDFVITGYSQMSSAELPLVVEELRLAFYIAVALVTALVAIFMRSVWIAALSVVPNLIPILGVEAWLALTDRPLTITGAIAFIIAFGIAVDDTLHLLNRIRIARNAGEPMTRQVVESALKETAAPVITTSIVLLAGFAVTAFSLMPSVSLFGQLTAAAMFLALLADLLLFPSLLCWAAKKEPAR